MSDFKVRVPLRPLDLTQIRKMISMWGGRVSLGKPPIATFLHDMIGDDPVGRFLTTQTSFTLQLSAGTLVSHVGYVTASNVSKEF